MADKKHPKRGEVWRSNQDHNFMVMAVDDAADNVFPGVIVISADPNRLGQLVSRWGVRYFHKFEGTVELKND